MERRTLASVAYVVGVSVPNPLTVQSETGKPELIGTFVNNADEKRIHTLPVGHPEGIHYSYGLRHGKLLKFLRAPFADIAQMWRGRGQEQLLVHINAGVEDQTRIPIARLQENEITFYQYLPELFAAGNILSNDFRLPIFRYKLDEVSLEDEIYPSENSKYLF